MSSRIVKLQRKVNSMCRIGIRAEPDWKRAYGTGKKSYIGEHLWSCEGEFPLEMSITYIRISTAFRKQKIVAIA
jgi:hypothetical protein